MSFRVSVVYLALGALLAVIAQGLSLAVFTSLLTPWPRVRLVAGVVGFFASVLLIDLLRDAAERATAHDAARRARAPWPPTGEWAPRASKAWSVTLLWVAFSLALGALVLRGFDHSTTWTYERPREGTVAQETDR